MKGYANRSIVRCDRSGKKRPLVLHEVHVDRVRRLRVVRDVTERAFLAAIGASVGDLGMLVVQLENLEALLALEKDSSSPIRWYGYHSHI